MGFALVEGLWNGDAGLLKLKVGVEYRGGAIVSNPLCKKNSKRRKASRTILSTIAIDHFCLPHFQSHESQLNELSPHFVSKTKFLPKISKSENDICSLIQANVSAEKKQTCVGSLR